MTVTLAPGVVCFPRIGKPLRHSHRRIISIVGDIIIYSIGADRNYACKRAAFLAWRGK